nr:hypothetical protein HmN_000259100 [Hymenolepis microstoma]
MSNDLDKMKKQSTLGKLSIEVQDQPFNALQDLTVLCQNKLHWYKTRNRKRHCRLKHLQYVYSPRLIPPMHTTSAASVCCPPIWQPQNWSPRFMLLQLQHSFQDELMTNDGMS